MFSKIMRADTCKKSEFPKLMESRTNEIVVLFTSPGKGTAVYIPDDCPLSYLGEYSDLWAMDLFENFYGRIILSDPHK